MPFFSIVIATHNRANYLTKLLNSIKSQEFTDYEIIISHTGADDGTNIVIEKYIQQQLHISYYVSPTKGASQQRNFGVTKATGKWLLMPDDDVIWENNYLTEIYSTIQTNPKLKGISTTISNQYFEPIGLYTRLTLVLMGLFSVNNIQGKLIGPAINFLPDLNGPKIEVVDWMPIGACTYELSTFKKEGMIPDHFVGYSFAEDVFVSSNIAKKYAIAICRSAKLFHYDLGNKALNNISNLIEMQVCNRRYICKYVLNKSSFFTKYQLTIWYTSMGLNIYLLRSKSVRLFIESLKGLIRGLHAKI